MTKRSFEGEAGAFFPDGSDVLAKLRLARYFAKLDLTEIALAIGSLLLCRCSNGLIPAATSGDCDPKESRGGAIVAFPPSSRTRSPLIPKPVLYFSPSPG